MDIFDPILKLFSGFCMVFCTGYSMNHKEKHNRETKMMSLDGMINEVCQFLYQWWPI